MQIFPEEIAGGGAESVNTERAMAAEIDLVRINLEDLLFAELMLEVHTHEHFGKLAAEILVRLEPEITGQLHGKCGGALFLAAFTQIHQSSLHHARQVQTSMLEKVLVLDR